MNESTQRIENGKSKSDLPLNVVWEVDEEFIGIKERKLY